MYLLIIYKYEGNNCLDESRETSLKPLCYGQCSCPSQVLVNVKTCCYYYYSKFNAKMMILIFYMIMLRFYTVQLFLMSLGGIDIFIAVAVLGCGERN